MTTLREIYRGDAFARVRDFDAAARFHVWHSRLDVAYEVDRRVQTALQAGRGYVVVGASGSGKTSTLAAAVLATEGFERPHLPLRLSVSGVAERASDPRFLASRVVRAIASTAAAAERLVGQATPTGTATTADATTKLQLGPQTAQVSRELRQRTESVDFDRTPDEVLEATSDALGLLRDEGVHPALLLEDADGLLRLPGRSDEERHALANAFFADGLDPLLRELDLPVAIAVQPDYVGLPGFERVRAFVDGVDNVPTPSQVSERGLRLLVSETLRASSTRCELDDVFAHDALDVLAHNRYSLPTFRAVVEACAGSVIKAIEEGHAKVEEPDIGYAISQS